MGTLNPSARRASWQAFKRKHPGLEKMPGYPRGLGAELDAVVSKSGHAKRSSDDYNRVLSQYQRHGNSHALILFLKANGLKNATEKYDKALSDVRRGCFDLEISLGLMDKFIAAVPQAAKGRNLDGDWRAYREPLARDLREHVQHIRSIDEKLETTWKEIEHWKHMFEITQTKMQKVKYVVTYPIKKQQQNREFKQMMAEVKNAPPVKPLEYKF